MKISIIIPAFNEGKVIGSVVSSVKSEFPDCDIIVVNDGSTDNTSKILDESNVMVMNHQDNLGYGAALKTGIINSESNYIVTMDSDGQHTIKDVRRLIESIGDNDAVIGDRQGLIHSKLWRMPGKWFLWALAQYLIGKKISDLNSGLRIVKKEILMKYLHLCPTGFSFSTTITMVMLSRGYKVKYIPINIKQRKGRSTVTIKSGFDAIILILRLSTLFNPLKVYLPISIFLMIISTVWAIPMLIAREGVSVGALLGFMTGLLLFGLGLLSDQISQLRLERYEVTSHE